MNWLLGRSLLYFQDRRWFYFSRSQIEWDQRWFQRYGFWSLLLAWAPVCGDALTLIAGVMKVRLWLIQDGRAERSVHGHASSTVDDYEVACNADGTTTVTNPLGGESTYRFVTEHGLIKVDTLSGACNRCGGDGADYDYDTNGFLQRKTDFKNNVTDYFYNDRGLQESRTEAAGTAQAHTIATTWHPTFRKPDTITEPHRTTVHTYSARGQLETRTVIDTQSAPNVSHAWLGILIYSYSPCSSFSCLRSASSSTAIDWV